VEEVVDSDHLHLVLWEEVQVGIYVVEEVQHLQQEEDFQLEEVVDAVPS